MGFARCSAVLANEATGKEAHDRSTVRNPQYTIYYFQRTVYYNLLYSLWGDGLAGRGQPVVSVPSSVNPPLMSRN